MVAAPSFKQVTSDQALFASTFLRILDKEKQLVPLHYYPIQLHSMKHETRRTIKIKPRQPGFTTMEASKTFKVAVTQTITSLTLAHLDVTTQAIRRMTERFYDSWPHPFPKPLRALANDVITTYPGTGSECITATAGSENVGHGLTITRAHLSEVSRWRNADVVMQGVLQAVPLNGAVVVETTTNGQSGWVYEKTFETLDSANGRLFVEGRNGWSVQFYPWWWAKDYRLPLQEGETLDYSEEEAYLVDMHDLTPEQIKWRRIKMLEEKEKFFESYPEDITTCFISLDGAAVFRNVRSTVSATCPFFDLDRESGEAAARTYRKANPKKRFVIGADWARDNDYSVFTVMDAETWEVVAIMRIRHLDWHLQRARLGTLHDVFQADRIIAESNSIGGVNISALMQSGLPVQPFNTNVKSKKMIIDYLAEAIEQRLILLPVGVIGDKSDVRNVLIDELNAFKITRLPSGDYRQEAPKGMHDDMVMSLAFALYGCRISGLRMVGL
jgi:hypothetical protein